MARKRRDASPSSFVPNELRDNDRRKRLVALCRRLPDASAERAGVDHLAFKDPAFAAYVLTAPDRARKGHPPR
jgi:hypothetical protein